MTEYLLSLVVFTPLFFALFIAFIPAKRSDLAKWLALGGTLLQFIFILLLLPDFNAKSGSYVDSFQFVEKFDWFSLQLGSFGQLSVEYFLALDGISLPLVLLSGLLLVIGVISSWNIQSQTKGYFILYMLLATSIVGCFVALDFFLFYLFFELMLLPMFFLIGIWGGERRSYASIKFFIYTLVGSLLILIVMIGLYISVIDPMKSGDSGTVHTFNILLMMDPSNYVIDSLLSKENISILWGAPIRNLAFLALMLGFAIKLPGVPVHTWLPDAHVEAPTPISVILAGLLLKVGAYGFFRIAFAIFPEVAFNYNEVIAGFGVLSILYGGLNALAQVDFKRMVAYSSVAHMGYVLVGLAAFTSEGFSGSVFHMVSHGLTSGALFLIVGMVYDRTHNRQMDNFSGLAKQMPVYTVVVVTVFFASLGLPGLSGFVGEFLVLLGAFSAYRSDFLPILPGILATIGIIISAAYYLWAMQRMFFGKYWVREESWNTKMLDINKREILMLAPLCILILLLGVWPRFILDITDHSINQFLAYIKQVAQF